MAYQCSNLLLPSNDPSTRTLQLAAHVEAEWARIRQRRLAQRWAPHLMQLFGIPPHESNLVCWLTDTACTTNAEAVSAWIQAQLMDMDDIPTLDVSLTPPVLRQRLAARLNTVTETSP